MTERKFVWLNTESGLTKLDLLSVIAMTKGYDILGNISWNLHMISGTIFTVDSLVFQEEVKHFFNLD
jgi:hypothetical protein